MCKNKRNLQITGYIIFFGFLVWIYYTFHEKVLISSDTTTMLPLLQDWISGNVLLKDWIVGTNNFFFTETIWCIPGLLLGMSSNNILCLAGAVFFVGFLFVSCYFFIVKNVTVDKKVKQISALVFLTVIGIVPMSSSYALLNLNSHNGLYFFIIIEFVLILKYLQNPQNIKYIFSYIVIGGLAFFSDGVALMTLIAPMLGFSLYYIFLSEERNDNYFVILISNIIVYSVGKLGEILLENIGGGLITRGIPIQLVSFDMIPKRLEGFLKEGKFFLGSSINNDLYWGVMFILLLLFAYSFVTCFIKIFAHKIEKYELILWMIVVFNLIGCLCTNVVIAYRYLAPTYLFGGLLSCIELSNILRLLSDNVLKYTKVIICLCMFIIAEARISENIRAPKLGMEEKEVVAFLKENDYGNGYADFWCGSVLSSYSNFEIEIYPIWSNAGKFAPYDELINKNWYREKDIHYIIVNADDTQNVFCKKQWAVEILGTPQEDNIFGKYEILYWSKDISDYMCAN